jgi:hypothetical protein
MFESNGGKNLKEKKNRNYETYYYYYDYYYYYYYVIVNFGELHVHQRKPPKENKETTWNLLVLIVCTVTNNPLLCTEIV